MTIVLHATYTHSPINLQNCLIAVGDEQEQFSPHNRDFRFYQYSQVDGMHYNCPSMQRAQSVCYPWERREAIVRNSISDKRTKEEIKSQAADFWLNCLRASEPAATILFRDVSAWHRFSNQTATI